MDIQYSQNYILEPFDLKYKRCGCYCRRPQILSNIKPRTHVAMPLKHIDYNIEITNGLASITLQQKYVNPTGKFLQLEFSFPIDPKACIYRFVAEFGNKRIEGIVKQKQEAKKEYEQAVKQGKQAVYAQIDPNSKDIMNMQIGNVGPAEQVRISISYLQELNIQQNTFYQLHLPSTISPRYMNSVNGKIFDQKSITAKGQYTWSFKLTLLTTRKLVYYLSQSHALNLISQNQNQTQTILCLPHQQKPNIDFSFLFSIENFHLPCYVLGRTDVSSTAMVSFIPKFCQLSLDDAMQASMTKKDFETDMNAVKGQYIFLLDRSGSMGGTRMQKAKQALILFLQSLPQDTYFNIVSFGDGSELLFKNSTKYNNNSLKDAVTKIKSMKADMGGTQIYNPLLKSLKNQLIQGYPKQIFLLTDGGVSNTEGVINLVGRQTKYSRCHSIGIGNGCSQALIKGCAQKGKGKFIFIQDSQNPSQKIIGLLEQTLTAVIDNVSLKYDKQLVQSIVPNPESIPYILKNQVINFYITFKGQLDKKTSIVFGYKDSLNKIPYQANLQVDPQSQNMQFVDIMAHSKVIRNLENSVKQNKPIQQLMYYVKITDKKQQAIKQSVKHQILSEYTAFICVNKQLIDGKFQQMNQKGKDKIQILPLEPLQYLQQRNQKLQDLSLKSSNLALSSNYTQKCSAPMAKKRSSGGFLGGIASSISNGISNIFGSSNNYQPMSSLKSDKLLQLKPPQIALSQSSSSRMQKKMLIRQAQSQTVKKQKKNRQRGMILSKYSESQQMDGCCKQDDEFCEQDDMQCQVNQQLNISKQVQYKKLPIQDVIKEQNVDGSFSSQGLFAKLFGIKAQQIIQQAKSKNMAKQIYISYLIAKWIQKNYPGKQYGLIFKKALSWIKKTISLQQLAYLNKFII